VYDYGTLVVKSELQKNWSDNSFQSLLLLKIPKHEDSESGEGDFV